MANKIILKKTSTASKVPLSTDLEVGEIAVNLADQKLYSKNAGGTVILVGQGVGGSGDVVGGSSSTDNALARYDGTTGKVIQNSVVTVSDTGAIAGAESISNLDFAQFDTTVTPVEAVAKLQWDDGNGTLQFGLKGGNVNLQVGQEIVARCYNDSGVALTDGQIVYISGAQGNRVAVKLALATTDGTSAGTLGMVTEPIAIGGEGFITVMGTVNKLNTSGLTQGAIIYLSPTVAGAYTTTKPVAPQHTVTLGYVERVDSVVGSIYVKVDNGYELDELHNVLITSPTSGNTLIYDAVQGVWENANISAGTGISVTNGAGSITVANTGVTSAVAGTGISVSGATGAVTVTNSDRGSSQNIFKNIAVSGQSTVVADSNDDTVTLANGTGISITTNATTDTITVTNTAPDQTVSLTGAGATSISGTYPNFTISSVNTTYSQATSTTLGLIELASDTVQATAPNAVTSTASRSYGLQVNSAGQGVINVPWTDTVYTLPTATTTVLGGIELGSDTVQTVAPNAVTATASRSYALQLNASGQAVVNVPWTDTNSGGTVTSVSGAGTVNGLTLSGSVTTSGSLTLGGAISGVPNSATTATSANTANAIVSRDANGDFSAGKINSLSLETTGNSYLSTTSGNTGVGTNNPLAKFTVSGGTVSTTYTSAEGRIADGSLHLMKTVAGGVFEAVRAMNLDTTVGTTVRLLGASTSDPFNNTNGGKVFIDAVRTSTNMDLVFSLNDVAAAAPVQRVRFFGNGNVNIVGVCTASSFTGAGTGLTGTASSLSIGGTASNVTGTVAVANGGTGATTASQALTNLGAYPSSNPSGYTSNTGTVTSITAGTGLSGGTITTSGTVALANTTVTAGSYTNANITVDAQGRLTSASNGTSASAFPSGTAMMFVQTSAPTGWTKSTTHDNKALRVVSGTAGSGGSVAFTTAFASQGVSGSISSTTATNQNTTAGGSVGVSLSGGGSVSGTTLAESQMPSHRHNSGQRANNFGGSDFFVLGNGAGGGAGVNTTFTGGSGSHTHGFTNPTYSGSFTGTAHSHTQDAHSHTFTGTAINLAVQYVDVIIATKD